MLKKCCLAVFFSTLLIFFVPSTQAAQKNVVVLAAFGSLEPEAIQSIEKFAENLRAEHKNVKIITAYTAWQMVEGLKDGETAVPSFASVVSGLADEGYTRIGVLSLQVLPGYAYDGLLQKARSLEDAFNGRIKITVSPPLVGSEQDAFSLASYLIYSLPGEIKPGESVVFAGRGGEGLGSLVYPALNWGLFLQGEKGSLYMAVNVDNRESINQTLNILKMNKRKVVWLVPLHTVYGKRAAQMFSTDDQSFASRLKDAGHTIRAHKQGLVSNASVQSMWKGRLKRLLADMEAAGRKEGV